MQYWQPAARLLTWAIRRLKPRSTLLSGSQTAAAICANACTILGLRCMIKTLLGTKPRFLLTASKCAFSSGECPTGSGSSRGDDLTLTSIGDLLGSGCGLSAKETAPYVLTAYGTQ